MITILGASISWIIANLGKGKLPFIIKLILITSLVYTSLCLFFSFEDVKGWPTNHEPPKRFLLKSYVINEPSPAKNTNGGIYLWVIPDYKVYKCPAGLICIKAASPDVPRSYYLPYTLAMHEKIDVIGPKIRDGAKIILEKSERPTNGGNNYNQKEDFEIYEIPDIDSSLIK